MMFLPLYCKIIFLPLTFFVKVTLKNGVLHIYIYIYRERERERERERNSLDLVFQSFQHEKYFKSFPSPGLGPGPSPSSDHIGTWDTQAGLLSHIKEVHTYRD